MFATPGTMPNLGYKFMRQAAETLARNWYLLLINGALLIVAGVLVFSIDWTVGSLATFIGALFIVQGVASALTRGIDSRADRTNVVGGPLSIAAGITIIVWPAPGIVAVAIILGSWLIVSGTLAITGALAVRTILPDWWRLLLLGLLEIPLGVLALANRGATIAALITVAGIWAVAVGVTRIALAFQIKRLPAEIERAWTTRSPEVNGHARPAQSPRAVTAQG